jgi:hypothetical protein
MAMVKRSVRAGNCPGPSIKHLACVCKLLTAMLCGLIYSDGETGYTLSLFPIGTNRTNTLRRFWLVIYEQ